MSAYFGYSNGRRGEEHSFILKPDTSAWKLQKAQGQNSQSSHLPVEEKRFTLTSDQYAVFVSCRCNYTGIYTCSWSTILSESLQEFVVYACHIFILRIFVLKCRIKIILQATNKLATPYLKGSYDFCCI